MDEFIKCKKRKYFNSKPKILDGTRGETLQGNVNVFASFFHNGFDFGAIVQDPNGDVIISLAGPLREVMNVVHAESLAIQEGFMAIKSVLHKSSIIELYCQGILQLLQAQTHNFHPLRVII